MTDLDLDALESTIELAIHCLYRYDAEGQELESDESKAVRALVAEVKRLRLAQTTLTVGLGQSGRYSEWARGEIVRLTDEALTLQANQTDLRTIIAAQDQARDHLLKLCEETPNSYGSKFIGERIRALYLPAERQWYCNYCPSETGNDIRHESNCPETPPAVEWVRSLTSPDPKPGPFHNAPYDQAADAAGQPCGCRIADEDEHLASEHTYCNPGGDPPCGGCHSCLSAQREYYERLDRPATIPATQHYTSTACHHSIHDQCRRTCKFCDKACECDCHTSAPVTALAAEDDAPYEQADQELADIERRVAADRAVIDAAKVRAQVLRDLATHGSGSDGWAERDRESDKALLAAVDGLDSQPAPTNSQTWEQECGYCGGTRWVDDQNWQPEDYERAQGRLRGSGRIPCGGCNEGEWSQPDSKTEAPHPFVEMPASSIGSCGQCFRPRGYATHAVDALGPAGGTEKVDRG